MIKSATIAALAVLGVMFLGGTDDPSRPLPVPTTAADFGGNAVDRSKVGQSGATGDCGAISLGLGAGLNGYRSFPADNPWNLDVSNAPVDPSSNAIIAFIGGRTGLHPDFGADWDGGPFGIPYVVVDGSQARVPVVFTAYGDESDPGFMPIPAFAPVEGGEDGDGDRHVLVLDSGACLLYELYNAFRQADGSWEADSAAVWDLRSNVLRPWGWTSADAAGLPIFPGLARYDEVAAGRINHALRFTVPTTRRAYLPPATHWASSNRSADAPPMGMRVRLKASVDLSRLAPQARVVAQALKTYGMILADNGSAWFVSGAPDPRWDDDELRTLGSLRGSDFEVVRMDGLVTAEPSGASPTISSFSATPARVPRGSTAVLEWTVTGATRVFVSPEPGLVRGNSLVVRPAVTTAYRLTAQGPYGSNEAQVTVVVY